MGQVQVGESPPDWEDSKQRPRVDADIDLSLTCEHASLESSWPHLPIKYSTALGPDPAKGLNGITGMLSHRPVLVPVDLGAVSAPALSTLVRAGASKLIWWCFWPDTLLARGHSPPTSLELGYAPCCRGSYDYPLHSNGFSDLGQSQAILSVGLPAG